MFDIYFAGSCVPGADKYLLENGHNRLFSYMNDKANIKRWLESGYFNNKFFVDSGAFTAWTRGKTVSVQEYIGWLNERTDKLYLFGQLDAIPGVRNGGVLTSEDVRLAAQKTWENYLFMRNRVNNKTGLLYTFHVGEPVEYLEKALMWTDKNGNYIPYIALGGMVGKPYKVRKNFLEHCFSTIYQLNRQNVKVHAFGMTDFELLNEYPIASADSTSWVMTSAMGSILTPWGTIGVSKEQIKDKNHFSHLSEKQIKEFNKLISRYGYTLQELSEGYEQRCIFNIKYSLEQASKISGMNRIYKPKRKLF